MPRKPRSFRQLAASPALFGIGHVKPHHYLEMARVAWQNRDNLSYAWRVLTQGVCDGCALGTSGLKDWTMEGAHLCMVRLELLRLNTMPAFDHAILADVAAVRGRTAREWLETGRLGYPMRRRKGERGFTRVSWDEVWRDAGLRWRAFDPARTFLYLTSRGITNEVYYVAQKAMRYLGSPNVDNSARLCHAPSTAALRRTLGVSATTCSYADWYDADVIVFFGSNAANDQPVTMKYLDEARRRGARVLLVNAYREPGMQRYWVPSTPASALFGTKMTDRTWLVKVGADLAFVNAVQKILIERGWVKQEFIDSATAGFDELKRSLDEQPMDELLAAAGLSIADAEAFARELAEADCGIFVWSMGITQHTHGTQAITGIVNLGLLREYVGRPGCGMMPIRGHSGVQGGAEMGAYATALPGGLPVNEENARRFSELWGFDVPSRPGLNTVQALEAALRGELDGLYAIGGNFLGTMPQPDRVEAALGKLPLRVHTDIVVTPQMLIDPAEVVYLLPAHTRYEQKDGGTETTTERRVIFSPYIPGHDVGEARSEWEILLDFARAVKPEKYDRLHFESGGAIREEIARAIPFYAGIAGLRRQGDQFQWGGPMLCANREFPTPDRKARFVPVAPPRLERDERHPFVLATRRGKQFNSMVQRHRDPLTGAERDHIFVSPSDARELGLRTGDPVVVANEVGEYRGRAFVADVAPGTLQGHWPELLPLLPHDRVDETVGIPDYNARVTLRPLKSDSAERTAGSRG
ncbi:MAG: FdhF/YdeP family oxidoreductase [Bryobacteraceae bacterium]|nr:FdhF/YdeP family oxidoreductase [Bryobacteraceae bacterium]